MMPNFRSKKNDVVIDGITYEKRVDNRDRGGHPHCRTILTEKNGTMYLSEMESTNVEASTIVRKALTPFNYTVAHKLLIPILHHVHRHKNLTYRFALVKYKGRMIPVPAIYGKRSGDLDEETQTEAAKIIMAYFKRVFLPDNDNRTVTLTSDNNGSPSVIHISNRSIKCETVCQNGMKYMTEHDIETGFTVTSKQPAVA